MSTKLITIDQKTIAQMNRLSDDEIYLLAAKGLEIITASPGERPEHTPLPWKYQEVSDAYTHIIRGPRNEFICSGPQDSSGATEADMRFIVTACNNYEALKLSHAALLEIVKYLRGYLCTHPDYQRGFMEAEQIMNDADRALANAKALAEARK